MTKLKLNFTQEAGKILTREDLKKILGGMATGSDVCAGKTTYVQCLRRGSGDEDEVVERYEQIGCSTNPCSAGLTASCGCY